MRKLMHIMKGLVALGALVGQIESAEMTHGGSNQGGDVLIGMTELLSSQQAKFQPPAPIWTPSSYQALSQAVSLVPIGVPVPDPLGEHDSDTGKLMYGYGTEKTSGPRIIGYTDNGRPLYDHSKGRGRRPTEYKAQYFPAPQTAFVDEENFEDALFSRMDRISDRVKGTGKNCCSPENACLSLTAAGGVCVLACGAAAVLTPPILAYYSNASTTAALASGVVDLLTANVFASIPAFMHWYRWNYDGDQDEMLRSWNIGLTVVNSCIYTCCGLCKVGLVGFLSSK